MMPTTSMTSMTADDGGSTTDASSSDTAPGDSSGAGSESGGTAGADSSGTAATDTGGGSETGSTGDGSTGAGACAPIAFTAVDEPGLTGTGFCEGVQDNAVLADAQAVADHNDEWCASVAGCIFPEPPCSPAPALPDEGEQIVYVFGVDSGCSGVANITDVLDCGDTIEVHYSISGVGMCGSIVHAWAAVAIPASDTEVVFVPS